MTTFADSLKREIARVARKELRDEITAVRKTSAVQRADISVLKKQLSVLHSQVKKLSKVQGTQPVKALPSKALPVGAEKKGKPGRKAVFTAERLKTNRARLGFTQDQMARLLEVSALSIWKWESGGAAPRASRVPQILQRLSLGKREALALITEVE
ncbi:helix-turn-helix domain-containing protein [Hydrogenophaga sp. RAC07]|uniref:helix-turn-helix domain-containing protein n=1 Tax=Hydrogenophaga sp. RAC07 TaxID=1842537 RepID=UPI00083CE90C|nr:helix-turn-helix domain-containing protein [Hydrogenophaga sp. RAC07]